MNLIRIRHGRPDRLKTLHPGYFAMVMATSIVAIAIHGHGFPWLSLALFYLSALFLVGLAAATVLRLLLYPDDLLADIRSHERGVGFFSLVPAVGIFGTQVVLQFGSPDAALPFWALTAVLWFIIVYGILAVLTVQREKPSLTTGLGGSWLTSVVATQSLSILTILVLPAEALQGLHQSLVFVALILWLGGGVLYMWLMTLIFFRYTFRPIAARDLTAPYWINMGAVAISTLAGTTLLQQVDSSVMIHELAPFIKGFTLLYWAVGTWWIPMLLVLGFWRYFVRADPLAYNPLHWDGIFPLGMYAVCTMHLEQIFQTAFLSALSYCFMVLALVGWLVALIGLVDSRGNAAALAARDQ